MSEEKREEQWCCSRLFCRCTPDIENQSMLNSNSSGVRYATVDLRVPGEPAPAPVPAWWNNTATIINSIIGALVSYVYYHLSMHKTEKLNQIFARFLGVISGFINGALYELISDFTLTKVEEFFQALPSRMKTDPCQYIFGTLGLLLILLVPSLFPSLPVYSASISAQLPEFFAIFMTAMRTIATALSLPKLGDMLKGLKKNFLKSWNEGGWSRFGAFVEVLMTGGVALLYTFFQHSGITVALQEISGDSICNLSNVVQIVCSAVAEAAGFTAVAAFNLAWIKRGADAFKQTLGNWSEVGWAKAGEIFRLLLAVCSGAPAIAVAASGQDQHPTKPGCLVTNTPIPYVETPVSEIAGIMMNFGSLGVNARCCVFNAAREAQDHARTSTLETSPLNADDGHVVECKIRPSIREVRPGPQSYAVRLLSFRTREQDISAAMVEREKWLEEQVYEPSRSS